MVLIFILIYFEWRDTENQQYTLGMVDQEHKWCPDYLTGKTQQLQGTFSDADSLSVGLPQESIIGPLLFLLQVKDLPTIQLGSAIYECMQMTLPNYQNCSGKVAAEILRKMSMKILMLHGSLLYNNSLKYIKYVVKTEAMLFGTHATAL